MALKFVRKATTATRLVTWDFSQEPEIKAGDAITGAAVAVSPVGPTFGAATTTANSVSATLSGGTTKTRYLAKASATTAAGRTLVQYQRVLVVDPVA